MTLKKKEEMKEKERRKYQKKKEKGTRKLVKDMSRREHKAVKKVWKEHCSKFRAKKKVMKDITNTFIRENTPDSEDPAEERPTPLRSSESALVTARKKSAKKKREKILKEKDLKIQEYKQKMENPSYQHFIIGKEITAGTAAKIKEFYENDDITSLMPVQKV
ncbi:hypothetical protein FQA39_LY08273 [Lamprigera yunnana]|nr:hypothetical protein FQA39_LY08273 [Lamprigera yunnana]